MQEKVGKNYKFSKNQSRNSKNISLKTILICNFAAEKIFY